MHPPPLEYTWFSWGSSSGSLSVSLGAGLDVWKGWEGGGTINHHITNCTINQPLIKLTTGALAGFLLQPLAGFLLTPEAPCPGCLGVYLCCPEISQVAVVGTVACCCCGNLWVLGLLVLSLGSLLYSIGLSWAIPLGCVRLSWCSPNTLLVLAWAAQKSLLWLL